MRTVFAVVALALASGCTATGNFQDSAVGIGGGPNKLQRTPCACVETQQKTGLPDFLNDEIGIKQEAHA